jgi:tetratricopeptide (TPR) repeat protein
VHHQQLAVHRAIVVVDVERFGDPGRTNLNQLAVRDGLYKALIQAFGESGIEWGRCESEDRGDGALILVTPEVPKACLVTGLPGRLATAISCHNAVCAGPEQIRLRVALHAGEVYRDAHGVAGSAVNHAFRLVEAPALRSVLAASPGVLAVIVSDWMFSEVIRHDPAAEPGSYRKVQVAVKETAAAGWIRIPDLKMIYGDASQAAETLQLPRADRVESDAVARGRPEPATPRTGSVAAATRTLPRDIASFTGREPELAELIAVEAEAAISGEVAGICEIGGMAGIGKTALAVHAAHQIATRFPDGQIFLPLHGHAPGRQPVDPADALASLLQAAGIPAQQIPAGLEPRAWLWRDHIAGKRLLLVLDDAAGHEQVRHLLPSAAGTLVLITARSHLTALEDSKMIRLDPLPPDDAAALLVRLAGRPDLAPGEDTVRQITELCGYLPLAVGMLARQLQHHPAWTAADLVADLTTASDQRLALMRAENQSVAAAFDLSYQRLTPDGQRLFRRIGLQPGPDIDVYAAAALDDSDPATAHRNLADLYDHYLLTEPAHRRYRMHDLIAEHCRDLAAKDTAADREAALDRLLDYYLDTASTASRLIRWHTASTASRLIPWRTSIAGPASPGRPPACTRELGTEGQAITWLRDERPNLRACIDYTASHTRLSHAIGITTAISDFMHAQGHWSEALSLGQKALDAARTAGDRHGQAWVLNRLGIAQELTGNYQAAADSQEQAWQLFREVGDQHGQAWALNQLGLVQWLTGDYPAAASSQEQARRLFVGIGDLQGQASVLNQLGVVQRLTGDYPAAAASQEQAVQLFKEVGDRRGQAWALNEIGMIQQLTGDHPAATASQNEALRLFREIGDQQGQAWALLQLSVVQRLTGDRQAADSRNAALGLFHVLGDRRGQAWALHEVGTVQQLTGEYPAAADKLTRAWQSFREIGDRQGQARALLQLGVVQQLAGDKQAAASLTQALKLFRALGDRHGATDAATSLGGF